MRKCHDLLAHCFPNMLLSVNIRNFRSCSNVELDDIHELLALLGRNGVGKTNILKAIEWAAKIFANAGPLDSSKEKLRRGSVVLRIKIDAHVYRYEVTLDFESPAGPDGNFASELNYFLIEKLVREISTTDDELVFSCDRGELVVGSDAASAKVGVLTPAAHSVLSLFPEHAVVSSVKQVVSFMAAIRYYPIEEFEADDQLDFVSSHDSERWASSRTGAKDANRTVILKLIDLWLTNRDAFDELLALLGENGINVLSGISVIPFEIPFDMQNDGEKSARRKYHFVQFAPVGMREGQEYSFGNLSFGTRRIVRLLIAMLYDRATVSLIEQPEDGIHPGLLHKLIPILRSYADTNQFLLTSHSPEVFNRVQPSEIRLVDLVEGQTNVRPLNESEIAAARNFMAKEGPLSEFIETVQER